MSPVRSVAILAVLATAVSATADEPVRVRPPVQRLDTTGFPDFQTAADRAAGPETEPTDASEMIAAAPVVTVVSSLAVVLGLFVLVALIWKKGVAGRQGGTLPAEMIEVLGGRAIDAKTRLTMVRIGGKIVVATGTPGAWTPLTEFDDPETVTRLVAIAKGQSRGDFADVMTSFEGDRPGPGFAEPGRPARPATGGRLFAEA